MAHTISTIINIFCVQLLWNKVKSDGGCSLAMEFMLNDGLISTNNCQVSDCIATPWNGQECCPVLPWHQHSWNCNDGSTWKSGISMTAIDATNEASIKFKLKKGNEANHPFTEFRSFLQIAQPYDRNAQVIWGGQLYYIVRIDGVEHQVGSWNVILDAFFAKKWITLPIPANAQYLELVLRREPYTASSLERLYIIWGSASLACECGNTCFQWIDQADLDRRSSVTAKVPDNHTWIISTNLGYLIVAAIVILMIITICMLSYNLCLNMKKTKKIHIQHYCDESL